MYRHLPPALPQLQYGPLSPMMTMNFQEIARLAVRHRYLVLTGLGALLYLAFIGLRDVWYPDEPDIAEVALAMFLSGDWVAPRRMGVVWVDYPPMIYWIGVISAQLFDSMTAFTLRLPNALVAISVVLLTCATASRWYDGKTGLWSGFALMTSVLFVYEANSYRPDILFTFFIAAGMILYTDGVLDKPRLWLRVAAFACLGGAMLAKGILGLLLPGLVLVLWLGSRKQWLRILELVPLSLVSVAVFLPWVAGAAQAMGWDNILYEFYAQNFARFDSGFRGHQQPLHYYLVNFWMDFSPWSWLVPAAIIWSSRSGLLKTPRARLLLWWFGTFFVFLSLAATKRQLYMLPAFPAIALLIGPWLTSVGKVNSTDTLTSLDVPRERAVHIYSIVVSIVFSALGLLLLALAALLDEVMLRLELNAAELDIANALRLPIFLLGAVMITGGIWVGMAWRDRDTRSALRRLGGSYVVLYVVILGIVMPQFAPSKTYKPQGEWIREHIGAEQTHIGMVYSGSYGIRKRGAFGFETGGAMVDLLETAAEVEQFFMQHPDSVVLVEGHSVDDIFANDRTAWKARRIRDLWVGKTQYVVIGAAGE